MNILLIEDNISIIKGLKYSFLQNNYNFYYTSTIKDTYSFINNNHIDLIILDITLPDGDGFNLYENTIKKLNIPTIFLTAKDDEENIVKGLNLGADDYITKPFSTNVLLARVNKALLKNIKKNIIVINDIKYDIDKMKVYKNNQEIFLTSLELKILNLLFTNIGKVVTRNLILDNIWDWTGNDVDDHTVTVYIKRIKDKLNSNIIKTIKGIGYIIDEK